MKFHGKITVHRYENMLEVETTEIYADYFEAKSIQSAKAHLRILANMTELFSWVQSWDNEKRSYTGTDLRWKGWSGPASYIDDGKETYLSGRFSERVIGETVYERGFSRYGKIVEYRVDIMLRWFKEGNP